MGILIDFIYEQIIAEIEKLVDIAEDESHKLNGLLKRLESCRSFYSSEIESEAEVDALVRLYVPASQKFAELADLLELGLAKIMERYRAGRLKDFDAAELQKLIRALFADTPLRVGYLEEIGRG